MHPHATRLLRLLSSLVLPAALLGATPGGAAGADDSSKPNVILLMADDLGWGDVGYNGSRIARTPALDAMAGAGLRFDRWYAAAPVCSPTRGSCLTGRHPHRYGIKGANSGRLEASELNLAEVLQAGGYRTGHFGKWHLGTLTTEVRDSNRGRPGATAHFAPPWKNGFEVCFSTEAKVPTYDPMIKPGAKGRDARYGWTPVGEDEPSAPYGTRYWNERGEPVTENLRGDDSRVIMDRVIPFVRSAAEAGKPFFAVVWFHAPHLPVVAGPEHAGLYPDLGWKEQMYYGCISALDGQVGRLRAELDALGAADNTMVWFSSDNGPERNTPGSPGPFRERKRSLREGGVRVPGLLVWPAVVKAPRAVSAPAFTGDYYPTILAAAGISVDPDEQPLPLDGVDLLPLIEGSASERPRPIAFHTGPQMALSDNRYKIYRRGNGPFELYDLVSDPGETTEIAARFPDVTARMRDALLEWVNGVAGEGAR